LTSTAPTGTVAFPRRVREIENLWVPLSDGCRLAARVWLPEDAESHPVPVLFEYIPYRKRDLTRSRDEPMHHYFAGHGYAAVRVDLRGSGDSDGLLADEYTEQEILDALEAIAWLARQPWSTGAVGMTGISWGGFNALQVAARRPPELQAVISLCASDDRYTDDAHYMGGCLLNENLTWGSVLLTFNAYPPDPHIVGDRWREMWRQRLENSVLFPARWAAHPQRDEYWKHGSVCEDYGAIRCPVYAIGGWADGYSNAVPRLVASLRRAGTPCKGLIGPWAHTFPHDGVPGPAIGFLQEALRWWDLWLKGIDTGVLDEPPLRVWMQESVKPRPHYEQRPGRWVAEAVWPSPRIETRRWRLGPGRLDPMSDGPVEETRLHMRSPQTTGLAAGDWCGFGAEGEAPTDQREDGGKSLTFDSDPLPRRLEILGAPEVSLAIAVDRPLGFLAVRLNDVAPDGASTRVTYGLLDLSHRNGHETPEPMAPGERTRVRLSLNHIAHAFPAGHILRLAVSTAYWPLIWPSPEPVTLTLFCCGEAPSTLELPERPPSELDGQLRPFPPPEHGPAMHHETLHAARFRRVIERNLSWH
jgi:putative CocE/NonD family hydrolase